MEQKSKTKYFLPGRGFESTDHHRLLDTQYMYLDNNQQTIAYVSMCDLGVGFEVSQLRRDIIYTDRLDKTIASYFVAASDYKQPKVELAADQRAPQFSVISIYLHA